MKTFILVMHLIFADGSTMEQRAELEFASIEECLDVGKAMMEDWHKLKPESVSGMHFCILKDKD
jgi:hypothetical protein